MRHSDICCFLFNELEFHMPFMDRQQSEVKLKLNQIEPKAAATTAAPTIPLKKLKTISAANFYHSNTPIFIRRNIIYVFTFHNPLRSLHSCYCCWHFSIRMPNYAAKYSNTDTIFSHFFGLFYFFVCEEISAHKSSICSWHCVLAIGFVILRYGVQRCTMYECISHAIARLCISILHIPI